MNPTPRSGASRIDLRGYFPAVWNWKCILLSAAVALFAAVPAGAELTDFQRDELGKVEAADRSYESGNYAEAADLYGQSMYTKRTRGLMFRYGMSLVKSGQPDAAVNILDKVTRDNPIESLWDKGRDYSETSSLITEAHFQLGMIYQNRGWWDLALASFQQCGSDWRASSMIASMLLDHYNDPAQALEHALTSLRRKPDSEPLKNLVANCYNTIGVQRDHAGDEDGALAAFKQALEYRPGWELAQKNIDAIGSRRIVARINAEVAVSRAATAAQLVRDAKVTAERPPVPDLPPELVGKFLDTLRNAFVPDDVAAMLKEEPRLALVRDSSERTTLHMARTRETAGLLLNAGADPNIKDDRGGNALFGAVTQETPGVAQLLVENGLNLLDGDRYERTVLHEAVTMFAGPTDTIKWLAENKPSLLAKTDIRGVTPLMLANDIYGPELIDLLLASGASLSTADADGKTAADHAAADGRPELEAKLRKLAAITPVPRDYVFAACESGDLEALKSVFAIAPGLVHARKDYDARLIEFAAESGSDEVIDLLIKSGARVKPSESDALRRAATAGRDSAVRLLLDAGADPNEPDHGWGINALFAAASGGQVSTVRYLLGRGANPKPEGQGLSPLLEANAECAAILVEAGADVNATNEHGTPLHARVAAGDIAAARFLIGKGAKVDARDGAGKTALFFANRECAGLLLDSGADVDASGASGTALYWRISDGDIEAARFLIAQGAKVDERDAGGQTPLFIADVELKKLLLEKGADVNALSTAGTPLHACVGGVADAARLLIEKGAKVDARDAEGNTPIHFASEECITLLLEHGADLNARNNDGLTRLDIALREAKSEETDSHWGPVKKKFVDFLVAKGAKKGSDL